MEEDQDQNQAKGMENQDDEDLIYKPPKLVPVLFKETSLRERSIKPLSNSRLLNDLKGKEWF